MGRVYNFSAGPAVLPEEVLQEAAAEMLDYQGSGMSVMEMSHRSKVYDTIIKEAEADLRELMNIPDNYKVLFLQGGASQQFSAIPMNLMKNGVADYIVTGQWAKKAYQEASRYGKAVKIASSEDKTFSYIPDCSDLPIDEDADYVYICENNTIYGTKYKKLPNTKGKTLVADVSSCFLSEPHDVEKYGVIYGGVQKNVGPAGVVIVFVQLMNYILNPISQVPLLWSNRKAAIALMEKLSDALSENVREEGREKLNGFSEKIEVKDLTYGYEPESPVLKDLDVQFDAGKSYAIVGGSGSGKSTLLNLLMGSSSNYQGEICIDGVSIKNIESESLYQLMTSVQQNVFVFNDTIRNNVTMFHEFPDKEVTLALERSGLSEFIEKRGEDFVCGENGANLSGGERQRISIARALLRKSPILLVDEATAALDAATARAVSFSILNLVGMTRIVVTHRLEEAILRRYDKILVMKNGTICEQGNFDTLMQQKGQFYSLFQIAH